MATTLLDTVAWQVIVPVRAPFNPTGSHFTATITGRYGGAIAALDSDAAAPGYGVNQISWVPLPDGTINGFLLTIRPELRGNWIPMTPDGVPGLVTAFADVMRDIPGSGRTPEPLGRSSFSVMPATNSPAVAAPSGGLQPLLAPLQGLQIITGTALQIGPQGRPGTVINTYPVALAQDGQTVIPYPPQSQPLVPSTVHLIVNGEEYFPPDITLTDTGIIWASPAFSLERSDKLVLRYT